MSAFSKSQGQPGASAYEIWLSQGNSGTEAQFLASLKGTPGGTPDFARLIDVFATDFVATSPIPDNPASADYFELPLLESDAYCVIRVLPSADVLPNNPVLGIPPEFKGILLIDCGRFISDVTVVASENFPLWLSFTWPGEYLAARAPYFARSEVREDPYPPLPEGDVQPLGGVVRSYSGSVREQPDWTTKETVTIAQGASAGTVVSSHAYSEFAVLDLLSGPFVGIRAFSTSFSAEATSGWPAGLVVDALARSYDGTVQFHLRAANGVTEVLEGLGFDNFLLTQGTVLQFIVVSPPSDGGGAVINYDIRSLNSVFYIVQ